MYNVECSRHGACSIPPSIMSYNEVMMHIFRVSAYYILKLKSFGYDCSSAENSIIAGIASMISYADFSNDFMLNNIICYYNDLIKLKREYSLYCKTNSEKPIYKKFELIIQPDMCLSDLLLQGQKAINKRIKKETPLKKCYSEINIIILKNVCHSIIKLQDYKKNDDVYINDVLKSVISPFTKSSMQILAKINEKLWSERYSSQLEKFGDIGKVKVNTCTSKGKAILVTGSNLCDLYDLLIEIKDIDVYTHGNLLLAHSFEKFKKFKNLKGHFASGNLSSDYSNFPGVIYLTRHSAYNLENVFRGKILSKDNLHVKNIKTIKNFDELRQIALKSNGFKSGKTSVPLCSGYNYRDLERLFKNKKHKSACIITQNENIDKSEYDSIISKNKNSVIFSFSNIDDKVNYVNLDNNMPAVYSFVKQIIAFTTVKNIKIYFTKCDFNTISAILILKNLGVNNLFFSECSPMVINPAIRKTFIDIYKIKEINKSP